MGKHRIKPNYRRRVLRPPDLDHCKLAVKEQAREADAPQARYCHIEQDERIRESDYTHVEELYGTHRAIPRSAANIRAHSPVRYLPPTTYTPTHCGSDFKHIA